MINIALIVIMIKVDGGDMVSTLKHNASNTMRIKFKDIIQRALTGTAKTIQWSRQLYI